MASTLAAAAAVEDFQLATLVQDLGVLEQLVKK